MRIGGKSVKFYKMTSSIRKIRRTYGLPLTCRACARNIKIGMWVVTRKHRVHCFKCARSAGLIKGSRVRNV